MLKVTSEVIKGMRGYVPHNGSAPFASLAMTYTRKSINIRVPPITWGAERNVLDKH
jgi:hypothetical protein